MYRFISVTDYFPLMNVKIAGTGEKRSLFYLYIVTGKIFVI